MLKNFKPRLYQETIMANCVSSNCLVVLPTGLGKTAIAILLAAQRLKQYPNSKIIMLAPTKPLVEQHKKSFIKYLELEEDKFQLFTGAVSPEKRVNLYKESKIIFCTPQTIDNDIISGRINLNEISLIIFDEAHRATGDYAYTFVAKQYIKKALNPRILALSASPGSDKEKVKEVMKNLYIENIELRTEQDSDVAPYVQKTEIIWTGVELPEKFKQIQNYLTNCYKSKLAGIKESGYLTNSQIGSLNKKDLLSLMSGLHKEISIGNREIPVLKSLSLAAEAMKVSHAIELLESQGIGALNTYFNKLYSEARTSKVKAVKNLVMDINFRSGYILTKNLYDASIEHPKLTKLKKIITEELGLSIKSNSEQQTLLKEESNIDEESKFKKIIIFTQFRESGQKIVEELNNIEGIVAKVFVGQAKKNGVGLSQKKQIQILQDFRENKFNVIVMTSVGEEGLDIPQVDLVTFYEPVPSAIRAVQRRGRTGRLEKGKVIILYTKQTRDETYMWIAHRREKKMHKLMKEVRSEVLVASKDILTLSESLELDKYEIKSNEINNNHLTVLADNREKGSVVLRELIDKDIKVELKRLIIGDYILSERVCIEYKHTDDFVDSIIDGRLLVQIRSMKESYSKPLLIIEGTEDIYSIRRIHANAIQGMIATITISYGIPIIYTKTSRETAGIIATIAKREQEEKNKPIQLHSLKPISTKEIQEYIVSALPGIGSTLNKPLLEKFGSIKKIVNSSEAELKEVDKIGEKKAKHIREILDSEYDL